MSEVECIRCEKRGEAIEGVPPGGKIGKELNEKVCNACWKEWSDHSIKLINEYRISLRDAKGREFLATQMKIFFKLTAGEGAQVTQDPPKESPQKT